MQLNKFTDIALKSFMYLQNSKNLSKIDDLVKYYSIPRNHLIKVLNYMVHKNWIASVRGRTGGLYYVKECDALKLGDIIADLEGDIELINCNDCRLRENCILRGMFAGAQQAFYQYLNQYTLKDLKAQNLLGIQV